MNRNAMGGKLKSVISPATTLATGLVPYKCAQAVPHLFDILTQNRHPMCEMRAARVCGKANIRERISVCVLEADRNLLHKFVECLVALAR